MEVMDEGKEEGEMMGRMWRYINFTEWPASWTLELVMGDPMGCKVPSLTSQLRP